MPTTLEAAAGTTTELRAGMAFTPMVEAILGDIVAERLTPGDRLASEVQLGQRYGISTATVRRGLSLLVDRGVLLRRRGSGTFVASVLPRRAPVRRDEVLLAMEWEYHRYHPFFSERLRGLRAGLEGLGWRVAEAPTRGESGPETEPREVRYRNIGPEQVRAHLAEVRQSAGLVCTAAMAERLLADGPLKVPMVCMGPFQGCPHVDYDWLGEVRRLLEAALRRGQRHLGIVSCYDRPALETTLASAHRATNQSASPHWEPTTPSRLSSQVTQQGFLATQRLLARAVPLEAIIVTSDFEAQGVFDALSEAAPPYRRVPVYCLINRESRLDPHSPYTALVVDGHAHGVAAADLLHEHLTHPDRAPWEVLLAASWRHHGPHSLITPGKWGTGSASR
jgi:DNA-binding LacI/PurR family transcriptional regulator